MRVVCLQMASRPFEQASNLVVAESGIREAARGGATLVVLPEYFATGCAYDRRIVEAAEPLNGPTANWMQRTAVQTGVWLAGGIVERSGHRVHNTFVLVSPFGRTWTYRKRFLPLYEKLFFTPGRDVGIFDTPLGRIGVMVCWDMIHGRLAREMRGGIDLLIVSSAWPDVSAGETWHPRLVRFLERTLGRPRLLHCPTSLSMPFAAGWLSRPPVHQPRRLAAELDVPVVYCNMAGPFETRVPGLAGVRFGTRYAGASAVLQPDGSGVIGPLGEPGIAVGEVRREAAQSAWAA